MAKGDSVQARGAARPVGGAAGERAAARDGRVGVPVPPGRPTRSGHVTEAGKNAKG